MSVGGWKLMWGDSGEGRLSPMFQSLCLVHFQKWITLIGWYMVISSNSIIQTEMGAEFIMSGLYVTLKHNLTFRRLPSVEIRSFFVYAVIFFQSFSRDSSEESGMVRIAIWPLSRTNTWIDQVSIIHRKWSCFNVLVANNKTKSLLDAIIKSVLQCSC